MDGEVIVADWSQAEIGYTQSKSLLIKLEVADWSQAEIGYTSFWWAIPCRGVADWSQAEIGYTRDHRNNLHS